MEPRTTPVRRSSRRRGGGLETVAWTSKRTRPLQMSACAPKYHSVSAGSSSGCPSASATKQPVSRSAMTSQQPLTTRMHTVSVGRSDISVKTKATGKAQKAVTQLCSDSGHRSAATSPAGIRPQTSTARAVVSMRPCTRTRSRRRAWKARCRRACTSALRRSSRRFPACSCSARRALGRPLPAALSEASAQSEYATKRPTVKPTHTTTYTAATVGPCIGQAGLRRLSALLQLERKKKTHRSGLCGVTLRE